MHPVNGQTGNAPGSEPDQSLSSTLDLTAAIHDMQMNGLCGCVLIRLYF